MVHDGGQTTARSRLAVLATSAFAVVLLLGACSGSKDEKKAAGQAVARVNKAELTVHQINFVLSQQRGLRPEQADEASRQILDRLIDQELAIQKAVDQKLDRDARVVAQIEAARREIISRAYFDRVGEASPKPSSADVKKYYDSNPALFAQRRVYQLQEVTIEAKPDMARGLAEVLKKSKSMDDFVNYLKTNNIKYAGNQVVRAAEQLPLNMLPALGSMSNGQSMFNLTPTGANVVVLVSARPQPVDEKAAQSAIEQFLVNDQKRKLIAQDLKALRSGAEIAYLGKFADMAKSGAAAAPAATPTAADVAASAVGASPAGLQGSAGMPITPSPAASGAIDGKTITKGLGLK